MLSLQGMCSHLSTQFQQTPLHHKTIQLDTESEKRLLGSNCQQDTASAQIFQQQHSSFQEDTLYQLKLQQHNMNQLGIG
jgi:hypothetical protein